MPSMTVEEFQRQVHEQAKARAAAGGSANDQARIAGNVGAYGQRVGSGLDDINSPFFMQDRNRLDSMLQGQSPWASQEWNPLIQQLQQQASGRGPSLAEQQYRGASQTTMSGLQSMARGSQSPGAAREAMLQQARIGQGMAAGVTQARTQEMMGAQSNLAQALGARDQINQSSYLNILAQQLGLNEQQLRAMLANQQYKLGTQGIAQQQEAARWNAAAGVLGTVASIA